MEVTAAILIQLISYGVTFGVFLGVTQQQFKNITHQLNAQKEFLTKQINNLEDKVEKHNKVVDRQYATEREVEVLKNRTNVSEHRISDLEGEVKQYVRPT